MYLKLISIFLLLLINSSILSQSNDELKAMINNEIIRLEKEIKTKNDSLITLRERLNSIENNEYLSRFKNNNEIKLQAVLSYGGKLKKFSNPMSDVITTLNEGDSVILTDYQEGYWVINKGQYFGFISEMFVEETEEIKIFKKELIRLNNEQKIAKELEDKKKKEEEYKIKSDELKKQELEYRNKIIEKYGNSTGEKLLNGYYWLGMTSAMAVVSLGNPYRIHKSVGSWGIHEQWVYNDLYLYFENGKLTSFQNTR